MLAFGAPAAAGTFEQGHTAYMRGDYAESLAKLRPLAELGHAPAAYILGRHYQLGQGVKRDLSEAWYWYRRAEARGHVEAGLFRHLLSSKWNISEADLARARAKYAALAARKAMAEAPATTRKPAASPLDAQRDARRDAPRDAPKDTAIDPATDDPTAKAAPESAPRTAPAAAIRRLSPRLKSSVSRVALRPSSRPATPDWVLASTAARRGPKAVRVTKLGPTSAPTRAVSPAPSQPPREIGRTTADERPDETAVNPRGRRDRRGYQPDDEDEYDVAVDPGPVQDDEPAYAPGSERPAWIAPPPGAVVAPGYWQYRAWQTRRWQRRRAWQRRAWRGRNWRRRGWRRN